MYIEICTDVYTLQLSTCGAIEGHMFCASLFSLQVFAGGVFKLFLQGAGAALLAEITERTGFLCSICNSHLALTRLKSNLSRVHLA